MVALNHSEAREFFANYHCVDQEQTVDGKFVVSRLLTQH